ncbi:hypothetical protein EDD36DRAFT_423280 [Exophiala viscosa]|uniref:Uncharacterized protein n=1 Tax=Exophiala viscosa TaxID=2486360 RepID=A0AAN6I8C0_9EURO|nr:hypothetical protein EDD36DRAFT_423280 [Exophiala viscosa]
MWFWQNSQVDRKVAPQSTLTSIPGSNHEASSDHNIQDGSNTQASKDPICLPLPAKEDDHPISSANQKEDQMDIPGDCIREPKYAEEQGSTEQKGASEPHADSFRSSPGSDYMSQRHRIGEPSDISREANPGHANSQIFNDSLSPIQKTWGELSNLVDSYTGDIITTGDLRRSVSDSRRGALDQLDALLSSNQNQLSQKLRNALSDLQEAEEKLMGEDEKLIEQGDQVLRKGSRIFGPAAPSSFRLLEEQGIVLRSQTTEAETSLISADDIRLDRTSEAQLYLSKKADVDLLRESLMELDEDGISATADPFSTREESELHGYMDSRTIDLRNQLGQAEEDLERLRSKLPDRKVNISEEQLIESEEGGVGLLEGLNPRTEGIHEVATNSEETSLTTPDDRHDSLQQILDLATEDDPIRSNTLVNAYLLYQFRLFPKEPKSYVEAVRAAAAELNPNLPSDPLILSLEHWFDDEKKPKTRSRSKPSKSRKKTPFSHHQQSIAMNADQSTVTRRKSEPRDIRKPSPLQPRDTRHRPNISPRDEANYASSVR